LSCPGMHCACIAFIPAMPITCLQAQIWNMWGAVFSAPEHDCQCISSNCSESTHFTFGLVKACLVYSL
jgi:hypothetical protein